jgi:hypothetical protein
LENAKERDNSEDLGVDGRILYWILRGYGRKVLTTCISLRIGTVHGIL